jgi:hypothetical protein
LNILEENEMQRKEIGTKLDKRSLTGKIKGILTGNDQEFAKKDYRIQLALRRWLLSLSLLTSPIALAACDEIASIQPTPAPVAETIEPDPTAEEQQPEEVIDPAGTPIATAEIIEAAQEVGIELTSVAENPFIAVPNQSIMYRLDRSAEVPTVEIAQKDEISGVVTFNTIITTPEATTVVFATDQDNLYVLQVKGPNGEVVGTINFSLEPNAIPTFEPTPVVAEPTPIVEEPEPTEEVEEVNENLISGEEALARFADNATFVEGINQLKNQTNIIFVPNNDGSYGKSIIKFENTQFELLENGKLQAVTELGVNMIYLPEVKDWGVEQFSTIGGLDITYYLSIGSMNATSLPTNGSVNDALRKDTSNISLLSPELFQYLITEQLPQDELNELRGRNLSQYENIPGSLEDKTLAYIENERRDFSVIPPINLVEPSDLTPEFVERHFQNVFFITFAHFYFNTSNPSLEQIEAIGNFVYGTATNENLQLLQTSPNYSEGDLIVQTNQGPWNLMNPIINILNEAPYEGEPLTDFDVIDIPQQAVFIKDGVFTMVNTGVDPNSLSISTYSVFSLFRFLAQNGYYQDNIVSVVYGSYRYSPLYSFHVRFNNPTNDSEVNILRIQPLVTNAPKQ